MKKLVVVAGAFALVLGAMADDYTFIGGNGKVYATDANWRHVDGGDPVAPTTGNTYWILDGKWAYIKNVYDDKMLGTLNIGSPASHATWGLKSGVLTKGEWFNSGWHSTANWYHGTIRTNGRYVWYWKSGALNVLDGGEGSSHELYFQDIVAQCSGLEMQKPITSESSGVVIDITCGDENRTLQNALNGWVYFHTSGGNSGYKGAFNVKSPYMPFFFSGNEPLGDPNVPNPAALRLCDEAVFAVCAAGSVQTPTRGVRLEGASAYLVGRVAAGVSLDYPVSKAETVAGNWSRQVHIQSRSTAFTRPVTSSCQTARLLLGRRP